MTGNGKNGCPCGKLRSRTDPQLINISPPFLESWPPGVLKKDVKRTTAVVRACVQCGTLYALTYHDDNDLPDA